MEATQDGEFEVKDNRYLKIIGKILLQFVLPIIATGILIHVFLTPAVTAKLFPQYNARANYVDIKSCSDVTIQKESTVFLPQTCESLKNTPSIGCVYIDPGYIAPTNASYDQSVVCPALKPTLVSGAPNLALPVFRTDESIYKLAETGIITFIVAALYIVARQLIVRRSSHRMP